MFARGAPLVVSHQDGQGIDSLSRNRPVQRHAARLRPDGADGFRSRVSSRRWACGSACRTQDSSTRSKRSTFVASVPSPARAPSMRILQRARCRPTRRPPVKNSASCPTRWSGPRSSTRNTAANPDLAALPMYCVVTVVQRSLRHEGHAHDVQQRRQFRHGCAARSILRSWRSCARKAPSSTRSPSPMNSMAVPAIRVVPRKPRPIWVHGGQTDGCLGGPGLQSLRHRTRVAWIERRLRRIGRRQSRHGRHLRAVGRFLPGPCIAEMASRSFSRPRASCPTTAASVISCSTTAPGIHARTLADAARGSRCHQRPG